MRMIRVRVGKYGMCECANVNLLVFTCGCEFEDLFVSAKVCVTLCARNVSVYVNIRGWGL